MIKSSRLVAGLAVSSILLGGTAAVAQATTNPDDPSPAIVQICLATSIEEVDDILDRTGDSELLDSLDGLVDLDIRDGDEGVDVDSSVQLNDVRRQLNCNAIVMKPTEPMKPTTPETPKTPAVVVVVPEDSGSGGGDVSQLPIGGVETGTQ